MRHAKLTLSAVAEVVEPYAFFHRCVVIPRAKRLVSARSLAWYKFRVLPLGITANSDRYLRSCSPLNGRGTSSRTSCRSMDAFTHLALVKGRCRSSAMPLGVNTIS